MSKKSILSKRLLLVTLMSCFLAVNLFSQTWIMNDMFSTPDAQESDFVGGAMSQYEDILVVGSQYNSYDINGLDFVDNAGAVYVYNKLSNGKWKFSEKMLGPVRKEGVLFGSTVCVYEDYLFVYSYEDVKTFSKAGKINVYEMGSNGRYKHLQTLVPNAPEAYEKFGSVMAANENYLVVGSPGVGSVSIFKLSSSGLWEFTQKLSQPGKLESTGFGLSLALSDNRILIGAPYFDPVGEGFSYNSGIVYYYEYDLRGLPRSWKLESTIITSNQHDDDRFGSAVAFDGTTIYIGCLGEDYDENGYSYVANAGGVYSYKQNAISGNWTFKNKLVAKLRVAGACLGTSLSVSGDFLAVGAKYDSTDKYGANEIESTGSVYLFSKKTGDWVCNQKIILENREKWGYFSCSMSLYQGFLVATSTGSDAYGLDKGAIFCYEYQPAAGIPQEELRSLVDIFPNPVSEKLFISLGPSLSPVSISLATITGSVIYNQDVSDDQISVDFSPYPTGIYFLHIETNQGQITKKIIHNN